MKLNEVMRTLAIAICALVAGYVLRDLQGCPVVPPKPQTAEEKIASGIRDLWAIPECDDSDVADIIGDTITAMREGKL